MRLNDEPTIAAGCVALADVRLQLGGVTFVEILATQEVAGRAERAWRSRGLA